MRYQFPMTEILQKSLPYDPFKPRPLPGIAPLDPADWLLIDEAYTGQMSVRARLLTDHRENVSQLDETARPAACELLDHVLHNLAQFHRSEFTRTGDMIRRPDGQIVPLDYTDPLATLAHLVPDDFCILAKIGDEHMLTGAVLCFPASWSLNEKFMQPLTFIHVPVASYDDSIAKRVQRLFDGVQPARPLWRFNALWYDDATLHQPRRSTAKRIKPDPATAPYFRSERQCILRLPKTQAVVFSIHTFILARCDVPPLKGRPN